MNKLMFGRNQETIAYANNAGLENEHLLVELGPDKWANMSVYLV